jgi:hypothetical protein
MLTDDHLRKIYKLIESGQTLDREGRAVDCGGERCGSFCCGGSLAKPLLPGEKEFLQRETSALQAEVFSFKGVHWFEMFEAAEGNTSKCMCASTRQLRPFACRMFPYSPTLEGDRVISVHRNKLGYLAACWIEVPGATWARGAVNAWQMVLEDADARAMYARLGATWERERLPDRDLHLEAMHDVLLEMDEKDRDFTFALAKRFFSRSDASPVTRTGW